MRRQRQEWLQNLQGNIIYWDETSTAIALNTFTEGQGPQNARNGPSNKTADPPRACKKNVGPRTDPQMHTWDRNGSAIARTEPHRPSRLAMAPQTRYARSHLAASCMSCTGPLCAKPPCIATSYARSHLEAIAPFTSDPCCSFDCFKGWV